MAKQSTQETEQAADSKGPNHYVAYTVTKANRNDKGFWTRIGAMFPHKDGEGFSLELEALPIDGRIVLRVPKADEQQPTDTKGESA